MACHGAKVISDREEETDAWNYDTDDAECGRDGCWVRDE
jgi:hypothetical protein